MGKIIVTYVPTNELLLLPYIQHFQMRKKGRKYEQAVYKMCNKMIGKGKENKHIKMIQLINNQRKVN